MARFGPPRWFCRSDTYRERDLIATVAYHGPAAPQGIMGASLGGAISLMIAVDRPEVLGKCGSQSGAMDIDGGRLLELVRGSERKPVDVCLDCGRFEGLLGANRSMKSTLAEKGYAVRY